MKYWIHRRKTWTVWGLIAGLGNKKRNKTKLWLKKHTRTLYLLLFVGGSNTGYKSFLKENGEFYSSCTKEQNHNMIKVWECRKALKLSFLLLSLVGNMLSPRNWILSVWHFFQLSIFMTALIQNFKWTKLKNVIKDTFVNLLLLATFFHRKRR